MYISPYKLQFKDKKFSSLQPEGTLLAFDFGSGLIGYSDFLPWPCFGEKPLSEQLKDLKKRKESLRFLIAKNNARIDALARLEGRNLFYGLKIPASHFLIENILFFTNWKEIIDWDYKYVKLKLNPLSFSQQVEKLKCFASCFPSLKWRLDLNGKTSWSFWKKQLHFMEEQIDFIEDPLENEEDNPLFAEDWFPKKKARIRIVKSSREENKILTNGLGFSRWKRIIFTHSWDHPVGQIMSAFWACQILSKSQLLL